MKYPRSGWGRYPAAMPYRTGFFAFFLLFSLTLFSGRRTAAQAFPNPGKSVNIVNGCARLRPEIFAIEANPAVLGTVRKIGLAASAENAWSLPELTYSRIAAVLPVGNGAAGAEVRHSGNTDYQESGAGFGYGLPLGKGSVGFLLHYFQFRAAGYQLISSGSAVFGLRIPLLPDLLTGISFSVPFAVQRGMNRTDKPAGDYRIEMGYLASAQVSVFAAWVKTDGLTAAAELGIDYAFADHFFFVAGLHGRTGAPFGKTGWAKDGWRLALYTAYEAPLGFSPGLSLSWNGPDKNTNEEKKEKKRK